MRNNNKNEFVIDLIGVALFLLIVLPCLFELQDMQANRAVELEEREWIDAHQWDDIE